VMCIPRLRHILTPPTQVHESFHAGPRSLLESVLKLLSENHGAKTLRFRGIGDSVSAPLLVGARGPAIILKVKRCPAL